jgi:hypothetical protein
MEAKHIDRSDPLIDEVRRIRAEIDAKFPNDLKGHAEYANKVAAEYQRDAEEARAKENADRNEKNA